ncbi:acetate--CoA ligase [Cryobacterium sp. W22_MBD10_FK3]|uniref:acetate--CoA ligase n=1 Tax=Cryobacterium sp. W22_MBD10_FK3 TaxID=3240273 RepID=UPI003F9089EE
MTAGTEPPTRWATIPKDPASTAVQPNLLDYESTYADFDWENARQAISGLPGGRGVNISHEAVDRHAHGAHATTDALRFVRVDESTLPVSYGALADQISRFASVLHRLGLERQDRVFSLLGRVPEQYVAAFGTLKNGSVFCPLYDAFGPDPVRQRLAIGSGRVLVTTRALFREHVAPVRLRLPELVHVLLVDADGDPDPGTLDFAALMKEAPPFGDTVATQREDMALLHFTSGTTGAPKGAIHVHDAVTAYYVSALFALDLHQDDIYWCTADPGWVTGMSYGVFAPLVHGITAIVDEGDFDADRCFRILADQRVTVWYTTPTELRLLMLAGADAATGRDLSALRFVASVGEPLEPELVVWGQEVFGQPVHDNWWQTETGAIMIANVAAEPIQPGSMGRPLPGVEAALVARGENGAPRVEGGEAVLIDAPEVVGELALRPGWPSMFRGYVHNEKLYESCFVGGWYLTGDLARRDAEGYYWFVGRGDDVIISAGQLVSPFEVESSLMEHEAVADAGVIGAPDSVAGEVVKAFVQVNEGVTATHELRRQILEFAVDRLGPNVAPVELEFIDAVPKSQNGKTVRRLLKAREIGLPDGDTSTVAME